MTDQPTPTPADGDDPTLVQPSDVPDASEEVIGDKVVAIRSTHGSLTLRPDQKNLDEEQKAALVAIGIDIKKDPGVQPHVRPFMHMCQIRGLDPWAKEAHLIGRGKGDKRKWTMQVGIDGYRKMAAATGRFIRVKHILWTGEDDDDRSYHPVDDGDGGVIMRRIWWDQWPASRNHPGAAKAVIEHLDAATEQVTTTGQVADWTMFAPYNDRWEDTANGRRRVFDKQGNPVKDLTEMWQRGGPYMLGKCSSALAFRVAFPAAMNGFYVHEEMHRLDAAERDRVAREGREKRASVFLGPSKPPEVREEAHADIVDAVVAEDEDTAQDSPEETLSEEAAPTTDPQETRRLLLNELGFLGSVLLPDQSPEKRVETMTNRAVKGLGKPLSEFDVEELTKVVTWLRPNAVSRLRDTDRGEDARLYEQAGQDVIDVAGVFGYDPLVDGVDPQTRHAYVDNGGVCRVCERYEDELPHPSRP